MASSPNGIEVVDVKVTGRVCCDFCYTFAEALSAVVASFLALVADGFLRRAGSTQVWASSTSGALLAALLRWPLLWGCICFGSVSAPLVCVNVAQRHLSWLLPMIEDWLLLLDCFTLPDDLLGFFKHEIGIHLKAL